MNVPDPTSQKFNFRSRRVRAGTISKTPREELSRYSPVLRKGNGQEWFPVQLKWPFLRQQLPYGEWELFHHSPIFTLITILFKIASANLYKCLTKTQPKPTKRTAYLLHLNIKQDQKGQLQSQFLHQHRNHATAFTPYQHYYQRLCLSRDRVVSNNG